MADAKPPFVPPMRRMTYFGDPPEPPKSPLRRAPHDEQEIDISIASILGGGASSRSGLDHKALFSGLQQPTKRRLFFTYTESKLILSIYRQICAHVLQKPTVEDAQCVLWALFCRAQGALSASDLNVFYDSWVSRGLAGRGRGNSTHFSAAEVLPGPNPFASTDLKSASTLTLESLKKLLAVRPVELPELRLYFAILVSEANRSLLPSTPAAPSAGAGSPAASVGSGGTQALAQTTLRDEPLTMLDMLLGRTPQQNAAPLGSLIRTPQWNAYADRLYFCLDAKSHGHLTFNEVYFLVLSTIAAQPPRGNEEVCSAEITAVTLSLMREMQGCGAHAKPETNGGDSSAALASIVGVVTMSQFKQYFAVRALGIRVLRACIRACLLCAGCLQHATKALDAASVPEAKASASGPEEEAPEFPCLWDSAVHEATGCYPAQDGARVPALVEFLCIQAHFYIEDQVLSGDGSLERGAVALWAGYQKHAGLSIPSARRLQQQHSNAVISDPVFHTSFRSLLAFKELVAFMTAYVVKLELSAHDAVCDIPAMDFLPLPDASDASAASQSGAAAFTATGNAAALNLVPEAIVNANTDDNQGQTVCESPWSTSELFKAIETAEWEQVHAQAQGARVPEEGADEPAAPTPTPAIARARAASAPRQALFAESLKSDAAPSADDASTLDLGLAQEQSSIRTVLSSSSAPVRDEAPSRSSAAFAMEILFADSPRSSRRSGRPESRRRIPGKVHKVPAPRTPTQAFGRRLSDARVSIFDR